MDRDKGHSSGEITMSWEDIIKREEIFQVGDVVMPKYYDTEYAVNHPLRINEDGIYLVVDIVGDRLSLEELSHPDDESGRPIQETKPAKRFTIFYDRGPDTSERDAERAFESRLYGGERYR